MPRLLLPTCVVDLDALEVLREGERLPLTALEGKLLGHLAAQAGRVVPREELLVEVWGYRPGVRSRAVDHTVSRLRAKLEAGDEPAALLSVPGAGYRLVLGEAPRRAGLPPAPAIVGRDDVLAEVLGLLRAPGAWVTLHGPGGAGKTSLALVAAHAHHEATEAVFVDLTGVATADGVRGAVCAALGLPSVPWAGLGEALRWRAPLLVLDNLDDVAPALGVAVSSFQGARVLATSRVPVGGERVVRLGALDPGPARALYARLTGRDDALVPDLLARLDHLPLAIHLAAARARVLPPAVLLARLDRDVLVHGEGRHSSLWSTVLASIEALPAGAAAVLGRLAHLPGAFDADLVDALGIPLATVEVLLDHSLLLAEPEGWRLYDQVRACVLAHHPGPAPWPALRLTWLASAEHWQALGGTAAEGSVLRRLLQARPVLERVVATTEDPDERARLVLLLDLVYAARGPARERLDRLLEVEAVGEGVRAALWLRRAQAWLHLGLVTDAEAALRASLAARAGPEAWLLLHRLLSTRGAHEEAAEALARAGSPAVPKVALARAGALRRQGRAAEARDAYRAVLPALAARGALRDEAEARVGLSQVLSGPGELAEAAAHLDRAVAIHRELDDPRAEQGALTALGLLHFRRAAWDAARDALSRAIDGYRGLGQPAPAAVALSHLGLVAAARGEPAEAERHLVAALAAHVQAGSALQAALVRGNLGAVRLVEGRLVEARELLAEAIPGVRQGSRRAAAGFEALAAIVEARAGRPLPEADPAAPDAAPPDPYAVALRRVAEAWTLLRGDRAARAAAADRIAGISQGEPGWEPWMRALLELHLSPLRAEAARRHDRG